MIERIRTFLRSEGSALVEILGLATIALTQPVLDVFGRDPGTFIIRGVEGFEIVAFAVLVALLPASVLFGFELLVGRVSRQRPLTHLLICTVLGALAIYGIVRQAVDAQPIAYLLLLVFAEVVMVVLWLGVPSVRQLARYLCFATPVFVLSFLLMSPVADLVLPGGQDVTSTGEGARAGGPVVFIVFDELPVASLLDGEGQVDAASFPGFARLADGSTWFRNNTTVAPDTIQAVPAVVTGRYPTDARYAIAGTYPESVFTALGGDYRMQAFEVVTKLCPGSLCRGEAAVSGGGGLVSLLGEATSVWLDRASFDDAARQVQLEVVGDSPEDAPGPIGERFVSSLAGSMAAAQTEGFGDRRLDYLHLLLPHRPFQYLPSGVSYAGEDPSRSFGDSSYADPAAAEAARDRHLLQLQYADSILSDILDELERLGTLEETTIVVTADHGAAFTVGSHRRGVTAENWPEILWTPFFIKAPGQVDGAVIDEPTRSIDVVPTLLDVLDVDAPWELDGVSGFEPRPDEYHERVIIQDWKESVLHPAGDDEFLVFDPAEGYPRVLASGPFGSGEDHDLRVLRRGEHGALVGQQVSALPAGEPTSFTGQLDGVDELRSIDLTRARLPLYRTGALSTDRPVQVAVAVDGSIAAVVPNQARAGGRSALWVLLSDALVGDGVQRVDLYAVSGEPGGEELRPIPAG